MAKENAKTVTIRLPKVNVWMIATVILALILVVVYFKGSSINLGTGLSSQEASDKAVSFINENLVQTGNASFVSVQELSGMYEVVVLYQEQQVPVYMTKDGTFLFLSQPVNTTQTVTNQQTQPQTMNKTDIPTVELFVMSFCPYGIQAEQVMSPVINLLGLKADIKIRFITQVQGNTIDKVSSLHGSNEALQDAVQVCIMKNYDRKIYWDYLMEFDNNCPTYLQNNTGLDACWKAVATKYGINATLVDTCSKSSAAIALLTADEQQASQYGVQGSPTLIINGVTYNGSRTPDAFKQGICSAFTTVPTECSQVLSSGSAGTVPTGGCAPATS
jgi:protein-disulfide isomerase